jgi:tetratricopeptide (TPR) repeat protein
MPDAGDRGGLRREAISIKPWARWMSGVLGLAGVGSGGAAVFLTHVEAGPVALIAGGVVFLLISFSGAMPTYLKVGATEAKWQREIQESVRRIEEHAPEVGALLDLGGASLEALLSGQRPALGPDLVQAGVKVGSLAGDVRALEARAGLEAVPPEALLDIGRWYMAARDWAEAARYLDGYVRRADADWEAYFALGVAYSNMRGGEKTDRESLRAYDEAMVRLPADPPADMTARLYSHRAAMKKRLGRLREAKIDAEIAKRLARERYNKSMRCTTWPVSRQCWETARRRCVTWLSLFSLARRDVFSGTLTTTSVLWLRIPNFGALSDCDPVR